MKKCKKIISGLLFICMLIGVTFASLIFMGVIGHTESMVNIDNENGSNVGTETAETTAETRRTTGIFAASSP